MADIVKIIDSEQASKDLTKLSGQLDLMQTQINEMSAAAVKLNVSLGGVKTPAKLQKELDAIAISQERVTIAALKRQEAEAKLEATIKRTSAANERIDNATRNRLAKEEAAIAKKTSTYYKLQAALVKLRKEYQDLSVKQNLGITISAKEEARLASLTEKVTRLDGVLKKTDAGMGVHTRSVGNYGKAFDSLGFSVAQMTRESPAFLISMNTGFMALSNNIPIFVDEINKLVVANKALAAEGKPQVSVLKKVAGALFSWQSLISMGIVLLTIYGGKLVEMAKNAMTTEKAFDGLSSKQEDINKTSGDSIGKFTALIAVINDVNKSEQDRLGAMEELKSAYPDFNAAILDEKDNTDLVSIAIDNYINKLGKKAKAQAAMTLIQEKYTELIAQQQKTNEVIDVYAGKSIKTQKERAEVLSDMEVKYREAAEKALDMQKKGNVEGANAFALGEKNIKATKKYTEAKNDEAKIQDEINQLLDIYVENVDFIAKTEDKNSNDKAKKDKVNIVNAEYYKDTLFGTIAYLEQQIGINDILIKQSNNDATRKALREENDFLKANLELLKDTARLKDDILVKLPQARELGGFETAVLEITNFTEKYGEQIDQAIDATNMFFDNRIEKLQQDRDANEEYYDNLISLARGNDEEQAKLEQEKEIRDKQLREKQNQAAKKQAIINRGIAVFNILLNAAQGIVAAVAPPPTGLGPVAGIPLAAIIGALGVTQSVAVASAPMPKFKDGTKNAPGGLAIVGDGGQHEFIEDRFGNILQTPNTDTLVNLRGGEKIHKDLDSLISDKGYNSNDIYKATVLASLASERGISTMRLEKVLDKSFKDLDKKINKGIKDGFKGVSMHNHTSVDFNHSIYRNNTL